MTYLTDSLLAYSLYILILALGIVLVGRMALGLIPNDATDSPIYRHMRMAVILVTSILAFMTVSLAVVLFALTAFGRPLASPALEFFEENPAQRKHQPGHSYQRHAYQRHAEDEGSGDEYRVVFQAKAPIGHQRGEKHSCHEDVEYLLHPLEFLEPAAVTTGDRHRFGVGGQLRAFAGNGGVPQFGGSHNRVILPGAGWGQDPVPAI